MRWEKLKWKGLSEAAMEGGKEERSTDKQHHNESALETGKFTASSSTRLINAHPPDNKKPPSVNAFVRRGNREDSRLRYGITFFLQLCMCGNIIFWHLLGCTIV